MLWSFIAKGTGYKRIDDKVDYKIGGTMVKTPPSNFPSSTGPVHVDFIDFHLDEYEVVIEISAQILITGIHIETPRAKPLQEFRFHYEKQGIQYENDWSEINYFTTYPIVMKKTIH